jgi:AcrR family transcriptional regulator
MLSLADAEMISAKKSAQPKSGADQVEARRLAVLRGEAVKPEVLTPRQNAVLECALNLLVEGGEKALTTAGVARAANCSKESLYKWFGDRDGLLAAMITYQSSKVRTPQGGHGPTSREEFREHLEVFAVALVTVLSGEVSLSLNRLAIGEATRDGARLGELLREHGRLPIEIRARALLEAGRRHGHLAFADVREAYETLYGLVVREQHVRSLLGETPDPSPDAVAARARLSIDQFFRLYGRNEGA